MCGGEGGGGMDRKGPLDGGYQFYMSILRNPYVALSNLRHAYVALSNIRNGHLALLNIRNVHVPCPYPFISHVACR